MTPPRVPSAKTRLLRLGFVDADGAQEVLADLGHLPDSIVELFGTVADPDQALADLGELAHRAASEVSDDERSELLSTLADDDDTARRLLSVLGASSALGIHLHRHPDTWKRRYGDAE